MIYETSMGKERLWIFLKVVRLRPHGFTSDTYRPCLHNPQRFSHSDGPGLEAFTLGAVRVHSLRCLAFGEMGAIIFSQ